MRPRLCVTSEIGRLEAVVVHRPGREIENLTPDYLGPLLFDDIPYLPAMQREHDYFVEVMRRHGVEVLYLKDLVEQALQREDVRTHFIDEFLAESEAQETLAYAHLRSHLLALPTDRLVETLMAGVAKSEIPEETKGHLSDFIEDQYPFYLDPLPNLYFTRDPAAVIGGGISVSQMHWPARKRESLFVQYVVRHSPIFADQEIPFWFDRDRPFSIEGGDQLVLSPEVMFVGVSERTSAESVETLARRLLGSSGLRAVVAVEIPKVRSFMHLDTVFTMVDRDKFTVHPVVLGQHGRLNIFSLERDGDGLRIRSRDSLEGSLKEYLHLTEVDLIPCGGGDLVAASREQWNDASNTFALAPGVVLAYDRNHISNATLRSHGVDVIEIPSSELSRGRGGPRCMSMPLARHPLD